MPLIVVDSTAVSIFVVILVELTNTVFVNSTNITTNIETAVLSRYHLTLDLIFSIVLNNNSRIGLG